jgi:hypothetical protein
MNKDDIGTWRIYMDYSKSTLPNGCVFELDTDSASRKRRSIESPEKLILYPRPSEQILECNVPYSISYCYLLTPPEFNTTDKIRLVDFQYTKYMGKCLIQVKNIQSGTYTCGVNGENESENYQKSFDVRVYNVPLQFDLQMETEFFHGDTIHLMCKTLFNMPISYCRYKIPNGKIYDISNDMNLSHGQRFSYYGSGLINGECGIIIRSAEKLDFGEYECTIKIKNMDQEFSEKLFVAAAGKIEI